MIPESQIREHARDVISIYLPGHACEVERLGQGHIHASFRVRCGDDSYLLQRLNGEVFPDLPAVLRNQARIAEHLADKSGQRVAQLMRTPDGATSVGLHGTWRLVTWIPDSVSLTGPLSLAQTREVGRAYGQFIADLADLPGPSLEVTLPDFHNLGLRLSRWEQVGDPLYRRQNCPAELEMLEFLRDHISTTPGSEHLRVVHNDAKLSNTLWDSQRAHVLAVIDHDTVMPGRIADDFGDLVRTLATTAAEDELDLDRVDFDPARVAALRKGFLEPLEGLLSAEELGELDAGGLRITFEQALRFLSDYIEGDVYYRVEYAEHNLIRARTQLRLAELMLGPV